MTLRETIDEIIDHSKSIGGIRDAVEGDIYSYLNSGPSCEYPNITVTQGSHRVYEDRNLWNFTVFYTDRLSKDGNDKVMIQSTGISVLKEIIRHMSDIEGIEFPETDVITFEQKFKDDCAGAYATFRLTTFDEGICG